MNNDRIIRLERIRNCRDIGMLAGKDGRTVRSGRLLRSAAPVSPSVKDLADLKDRYRLAKVIDLRTDGEKGENPDVLPDGTVYIHNPVFADMHAGVTHEEETRRNHSLPDMRILYRMMMTRKDCLANLSKAAQTIMTHDYGTGSVLWHCTEGKDRCGLVSMIIEMALGMDRDTVREDYLMTNLVNRARAEAYYRQTLVSTGREEMAAAVRDLFLAKEEYLDAALEAVDSYGSDEAFLTEGLQIPEEVIKNFRDSMLE
ncbi:MAG: tyrosine-protein phosphatase [Solobacterium sp.]|nr:tyrosine-protein phosphatase [Solobacterium sp.]